MRHDEIPNELRSLAYDFFFWFSRFEYALKESRFLKYPNVGDRAEPGWNRFISEWKDRYRLSRAGQALIAANPRRQVVTAGELDFQDLGFDPRASELEQVVRYAQAVRNNLFHGGKHGSAYWNDPERTRTLLATTIAVLDDLAFQTGMSADYRSEY